MSALAHLPKTIDCAKFSFPINFCKSLFGIEPCMRKTSISRVHFAIFPGDNEICRAPQFDLFGKCPSRPRKVSGFPHSDFDFFKMTPSKRQALVSVSNAIRPKANNMGEPKSS